jgi:hypothetical protein
VIPEAEPRLQNSRRDQQPGAPASLATGGQQSLITEPGGAPTEEASELNIQPQPADQKLNIQSGVLRSSNNQGLNIQPDAPTTVSEPPAGGKLNIQSNEELKERAKVVDLSLFRARGASGVRAAETEYDKKKWKRARCQPGYLIMRIPGYDIVEQAEYGVSYVWVYSRKPLHTSSDCEIHEHAGFLTWRAMRRIGRLVKEKVNEQPRNKSLSDDRSGTS